MRGFLLCLLLILKIPVPMDELIHGIPEVIIAEIRHGGFEQALSPMEALDLVKERYAANFDKVYEASEDEYYYKLASADYYLVYEGETAAGGDYLIHLYEFVVDEPETGLGHTVTYGWFSVDRVSRRIIEKSEIIN